MTEPLIVWPLVVKAVYEYLAASYADDERYAGTPAVGRVPSPRPDRFTLVTRVGGAQISLIRTEPLVLVESWGATDDEAELLAEHNHALLMRAARVGWLGDTPVQQIAIGSLPQRLPDPLSLQERYTALYAPRLRGTAA